MLIHTLFKYLAFWCLQCVCWTYSVSLEDPDSLSPTDRLSVSVEKGLLGHTGWLSSQWRGRRHVKNNSATIKRKTIQWRAHQVWLQGDLSTVILSPGTGPACLCPVLKGWGGRWGVSGTSPPHWSPEMTAHHRPESETLGPSHTAGLCSRCCMVLRHWSAHRLAQSLFYSNKKHICTCGHSAYL